MTTETWNGAEDGPPPASLIGTGQVPYIPGGAPGRPLPPQFGPRPGAIRRKDAEAALIGLIARLVQRAMRLDMKFRDGGTEELDRAGSTLWAMLTHENPVGRNQAAVHVARDLLDVGEDDTEWWGSHLGRMVARAGGFQTPYVHATLAAAVLGVTRQAVAQMVSRGVLERHLEGGIVAESLAVAALERWPLAADRPAKED